MEKPALGKLKLTIVVGLVSSTLAALACFSLLTILAGGGQLPTAMRIFALKATFVINFAAEVGLTSAVLTHKIDRAGAACMVGGSAIGGYSALSSLIFPLACLPCGVLPLSTALWLTSLSPFLLPRHNPPLAILGSLLVVIGAALSIKRGRFKGAIT